jgi:hypothetical protein
MKAKLWIAVALIALIILTAVACVFMLIAINNIIGNSFANQLFETSLPPQTSMVSKEKYVGNLGPTGNHLDFLAVMEIETSLTEQDILAYYSNILLKPANEVSAFKPKRGFFDTSDVRHPIRVEVIRKNQAHKSAWFPGYSKTDVTESDVNEKLYIIQICDAMYAPGWDLRTH